MYTAHLTKRFAVARWAFLLVPPIFFCAAAGAEELPSDPLAALDPLAEGDASISLGPTALTIARALNKSISQAAYEERLDAYAAEIRPALDAARDTKGKLDAMAAHIYTRWGFADRTALSADVFVSFADVLDRRQWNCVSMSALYIALGERLGLPMDLVTGRGHVLVRCDGYYIETTRRGKVYETLDYLETYLPFPCVKPEEYVPVTKREAVAVLLTQTGGAVVAQGKAEFAHACFQYALKFDPDHAEANAALGFLYAQAGSIDRAIGSFRAAIRCDPKLREAYGGLGAALHARGDLTGAAQALRRSVELCPEQPEPVFNLGQVLYESGDLNASSEAFRTYTKLVPDDPEGHVRLAFPLEDSGRLDEALSAYNGALRLAPNHADALVNSGAILEKQKKWDSARAAYEKCLATSPNNALAYAGTGRVLVESKQFDDAARAFARSIELDPANPAAWIDFAKLDRKRGDTAAALGKLQRALAINPDEAETHIELADLHREQGNLDKAVQHAASAQRLGAKLPDPLEALVAASGGAAKPR